MDLSDGVTIRYSVIFVIIVFETESRPGMGYGNMLDKAGGGWVGRGECILQSDWVMVQSDGEL